MPRALALGLEAVHQGGAVPGQGQSLNCCSGAGIDSSGSVQVQAQFLAAQLAHQLRLVFHQYQLAAIDDADAVGHLLGFLDVMRGQDDGDAAGAQLTHHLPHVAAQFHVDAGRGFVEEQYLGSCTSALAIIMRRFMPPDRVMILASRLSHSDSVRSTRSITASILRLAEQPTAEARRGLHGLEGVGGDFLGHQANQ